MNVCYLSLIGANSGYYNLKLGKKSSYLATYECQFGRYRFTRLPFRVAPTHDMFKPKIDEIFKGLPNIFGIPDYHLIVGYDASGRNQEKTKVSSVDVLSRELKTKQK